MGAFSYMKNTSFEIENKNKNILVIGDSHTECTVDDNIFDRSINISLSGVHYAFTYAKLKKVLEQNSQIDTVLLSFHPKSINAYSDKVFLDDEVLQNRVRHYILYLNPKDLYPLNHRVVFWMGYIKAPISSFSSIIKKYKSKGKSQISSLGAYLKLDRDGLQKNLEAIGSDYPLDSKIDTTSKRFLFLQNIKEYCDSQNVKLILFNSPVYKPYTYYNIYEFEEMRKSLLSEIDYLNFSNFPFEDKYYGDMEHLNFNGAEIFSHYLQDVGLIDDSICINNFLTKYIPPSIVD